MNQTLPKQSINDNLMLQFFISLKFRFWRHSIIILFSIIVLYYSDPEYGEPIESYSRMLTFIQILLLAYTNMYFLVPKYLFKNKYLFYILFIFLGIFVLSILHTYTSNHFEPYLLSEKDDSVGLLQFSFIIIVIISASAAIKLFQRWMLDAQLISELKQANTIAELEQLKNQINPHFLFNMLNNANVLTKKDPEKASQVLMKLSDLLRYQLYDSARETVLLTSDIHFLEDFLNLEKVRRDNFDFLISKEGNLRGVLIPPLLFISFVENAIKHNNDSAKSSYVNLSFEVRANELIFKCVNSKPILRAVNTTIGGLGLVNIKRRLELLFPLSHTIKIEDSTETYCVTLSINL